MLISNPFQLTIDYENVRTLIGSNLVEKNWSGQKDRKNTMFVIYRNVDNVGNLVGHPGDICRRDAE